MICNRCGKNAQDGIRFCPNCGAELGAQYFDGPEAWGGNSQNDMWGNNGGLQNPAGNDWMSQPVKKKSKLPLIIGLSAGGAALVAGIVVLLVMFLGGGKANKLEKAFQQLKAFENLQSADFELSMDVPGAGMNIDGAFKLGNDVRDSYFYINVQGIEAAYTNDEVAVKASLYGETGYEYNSGFIDDASDKVSDNLGVDFDLNKLISNGKIDFDYLEKTLKNADTDKIMSGDSGDTETKLELIKNFLTKECDKKQVLDKFLVNYSENGGTTTMEIDIAGLAEAFYTYVEEQSSSRDTEIAMAASDLIDSIGGIEALDEIRDEMGSRSLNITIAKQGKQISRLEISAEVDGRSSGMELILSNHGNPSTSKDDVEKLITDARMNY